MTGPMKKHFLVKMSEAVSDIEEAYDSQDENLSSELERDWSEPDDYEDHPDWIPTPEELEESAFSSSEDEV